MRERQFIQIQLLKMEINIDRVPYPLRDTNILKVLHNHYDNLGHTYVVIYM